MIERGESTIDELGNKLRSLGPVHVRLMVRQTDEGPLMASVIVNAGHDNAGFGEATYDYGDVAFVRAVLDGSTVADWLLRRSGEVDGVQFSLPEPQRNCFWDHVESRTHAYYQTFFATPHTDYRVHFLTRTEPSRPKAPLAGAGLPFYEDETVAAASVLLDDHSARSNRSIPDGEMLVWIAHPEAYIGKVLVSSAAVVATVLGEDLEGVELQVTSAGESLRESISEPGDLRVPISGADSTDAWVSLVRGRECLDFRRISNRWPDPVGLEDIVYEPDELNELLERMRRGGENEEVEFKVDFPEGNKIARAVAAFANGNGGTIIVGIRDGGDVAGIRGDVAEARDTLDNIVSDSVRPPPKYRPFTGTLEGLPVLAIRVAPGDDRPYGVGPNGRRRYYIRRGATNRVAEPEEMREICESRQPHDRHAANS